MNNTWQIGSQENEKLLCKYTAKRGNEFSVGGKWKITYLTRK